MAQVHNKGERSKALVAPETQGLIDEGASKARCHQGNPLRKATQMSTLLTCLTVMMIGAWTLEALFFAVQWRALDRENL